MNPSKRIERSLAGYVRASGARLDVADRGDVAKLLVAAPSRWRRDIRRGGKKKRKGNALAVSLAPALARTGERIPSAAVSATLRGCC